MITSPRTSNVPAEPGFLQQRGIDGQRNRANRFHVRRDVFAGGAVAARHAAHQRALLIKQRKAQAVEFVLGDVIDFLAAGELAHAAVEFAERLERKCVVEADHRRRVPHFLKALARRAAHALRGRIGSPQFRILGFELLEPLHEPVELRVGNFRIVRDVIEVLVVANLFAQASSISLSRRRSPCGSGLGHGNLSRKSRSKLRDIIQCAIAGRILGRTNA